MESTLSSGPVPSCRLLALIQQSTIEKIIERKHFNNIILVSGIHQIWHTKKYLLYVSSLLTSSLKLENYIKNQNRQKSEFSLCLEICT